MSPLRGLICEPCGYNCLRLNDFYNDGFGWVCRHCARELADRAAEAGRSRLMTEGEGESRLSNAALAKWADVAQTTLECPRCGITERVDVR